MDCRPEIGDASEHMHALWQRVCSESIRYAAPASQWGATRAPLLWITGLAGSGKSTLATALQTHLAAHRQQLLRLDGDALRELFDGGCEDAPYAPEQRRRRALRLLRLAHAATAQGLPTVVATISLQQDIHAALRASQNQLGLLVLQAPLDLLRQRRPELYADPAGVSEVVGLGQRADWPCGPARIVAAQLPLSAQLGIAYALWGGLQAAPSDASNAVASRALDTQSATTTHAAATDALNA